MTTRHVPFLVESFVHAADTGSGEELQSPRDGCGAENDGHTQGHAKGIDCALDCARSPKDTGVMTKGG
jgi:hypothetical protein